MLTQRLVYGEQHPGATVANLRERVYLRLDQAGAVFSEQQDFKGNLVQAGRRLTSGTQYRGAVNWRTVDQDQIALPAGGTDPLDLAALAAALAGRLQAETFTGRTRFDALNRPVQAVTPASDQPGARHNVVQPVYNQGNLLERLDVWIGRGSAPAGLLEPAIEAPAPVGVSDIDYDAKGQRSRIEYRNGVTTTYTYDPDTFRLVHLYTRRGPAFAEDCGGAPAATHCCTGTAASGQALRLQNLYFSYDPAGNITRLRDDAQQTVFFRNQIVDASHDYTYDATYRLVQALGREHVGHRRVTDPPRLQ